MQRRKALVLAGTLTLAVGTATVAFAAAKPRVVVRTHNVYDTYVVDGSAGGSGNGSTNGGSDGATPAAGSAAPMPSGAHAPSGKVSEPPDTTPTTADPGNIPPAPQPTTTTVAPTPTTRPRGVPADWPPGKPIPPKPVPCYQGQLELNGVWDCQSAPGDD